MAFEPFNRYVLIEKKTIEELQTSEPKSTILVPDTYTPEPLHGLYKVVNIATDCEKIAEYDIGKTILINTSMIENIEVTDQNISLILENYIYGIFENDGGVEDVN